MAIDKPSAPTAGELERFAAVLFELEDELDWALLGASYCEDDGSDFFSAEQIEAIREAGLRFASDIAAELEDALEGRSGRSLYVGAAVAELVPALFESVALGRKVVLHNLPGPEAKELNRALDKVASRLGIKLPRVMIEPLDTLESTYSFQHVWMTSVLSDPDHFPAIHNKVYERSGAQAASGGDLGLENLHARNLVRQLIDRMRVPGLFTTSDEESSYLIDAAKRRKLRAVRPEAARLSAIVGDPVRIWRLFPQ